MTAIRIEYGDNGKVAREKINSIIDEVNASIPSIGENGNWYIGGVDTGICAVGFRLKQEDNLIKEENTEITVDLQFQDGLTPTSSFPLGITVGNVSSDDNWITGGILLNMKTEDSYSRILYGDDGNAYLDGGLGVFKKIATTEYVDSKLQELRNSLHEVAFTGKSSDLNNDYGFSAVPIITWEEWIDIPTTGGDDKEYFIYENKIS